jgi:hypothetical protein
MSWRVVRLTTIGIFAVYLAGSVASARGAVRPRVFDVETDCTEAVPEAYSVASVTDDGRVVALDVALVLDGVRAKRARDLVRRAATAYASLNVELRIGDIRRISIKADVPPSGSARAKVDGGRLIDQTKRAFGGRRPDGMDVVHVLTTKDLTLDAYGSAPIGVAECVGGVRYPDKAFSASEDGPDSYSLDVAGATEIRDAPAEAIAHELGHLLGAQHHYKSCAEGADASDVTGRDPSPCTVMSDIVDVASLRFGALEAAVVRGHALDFAAP